MIPEEFEIEGKKFKVEIQEVQPSFFFPEKGVSLPGYLVSGWLEGIAQPITVVVPTEEATLERIKEEIKKRAEEITKALEKLRKAK